jgi:hypothetical protein
MLHGVALLREVFALGRLGSGSSQGEWVASCSLKKTEIMRKKYFGATSLEERSLFMQEPSPPGAMKKNRHPGTILFVDGRTQRVTFRVDAAEVPRAVRFAETKQGRVPVVKVVAYPRGNQRIIREYGPADELLRTSVVQNDPMSGVSWWT